jgi:diaminohydroxyphosphoribosylaminopyrimidine deaminase/5-amino-6-(5-phosphoribosylamino)uracil reductase
VLDGRLSVPLERKIFRTDKAPTWIVTSAAAVRNSAAKMKKLTARGVRIIQIKSNADELEPVKILKQIAAEGVTSVFIEGGSGTAGAFLGGGFADKLYLFTALKILGSGQGTFDFKIPKKLGASLVLKNVNVRILGSDLLIESYL